MTDNEKLKRKRAPDPWWRFPQPFGYTGSGYVETLIPHLEGYRRGTWRNGELSLNIEEIEADQQYWFALTYNAELSSGPYQASLTGQIKQTLPETFVVDAASTIALGGLANLVFYLVLVIFISIPVAASSLPSGSFVLAVLSTPMLLPLFLHLWYRKTVLSRFEQILRHYEVYGPHVVLESDAHPAKRRPSETMDESQFIFEDGMLREKKKQA